MIKNKQSGFSLIELLTIIALLAVLMIITVPVVIKAISKQKEKLYYDQLNQLIISSQSWAIDNVDLLNENLEKCGRSLLSYKPYKLSLSDLKNDEGDIAYISKDFKNPKTDENFDEETTYILVYKQEKSFLYCVMSEGCVNDAKYDEYKEIASKICCTGEDFQSRISDC